MMSDIKAAFPAEPKHLDLRICDDAGDVVETHKATIRRFRTGDIPKILAAIAPINKELKALAETPDFDPTTLFFERAGDCLNFVCVTSGVPRDVLDKVEFEDTINLFTTVLEVNLDFFVKRVLPTLVGALRRLKDVWTVRSIAVPGLMDLKEAGPTASTTSSPPATGATSK
jgi:hypothetical protein